MMISISTRSCAQVRTKIKEPLQRLGTTILYVRGPWVASLRSQ
jgi:hypothetical protein